MGLGTKGLRGRSEGLGLRAKPEAIMTGDGVGDVSP